jgi:hypothetical protein
MFRLDVIDQEGDSVLRVAGRLKGEAVDILWEQTCGLAPPYTVDLRELVFADARGLEALHHLEQSGVRLIHVPELVRMQLERTS